MVSLTANLALGVAWWKQSGKGALTGVGDSEPVIKPERSPSEWQSLVDGATDEEFVARLRQEGFPSRVIREWLKWRIWKRFTDRSNRPRSSRRGQIPRPSHSYVLPAKTSTFATLLRFR